MTSAAAPPNFASSSSYAVEVHSREMHPSPYIASRHLAVKGARYDVDDNDDDAVDDELAAVAAGEGGGADSRLSFCSDDLPIRDSNSQMELQQLPSSIPSPIDQERIDELIRSAKMQFGGMEDEYGGREDTRGGAELTSRRGEGEKRTSHKSYEPPGAVLIDENPVYCVIRFNCT